MIHRKFIISTNNGLYLKTPPLISESGRFMEKYLFGIPDISSIFDLLDYETS